MCFPRGEGSVALYRITTRSTRFDPFFHSTGQKNGRDGADSQQDHFLAWLEKETGADPPTIGTVVLGRIQDGPGPRPPAA
jgi:hypothetical protein